MTPFASPFSAGSAISFRHAMMAAAGLVLAALVAMAALTAMALADADRLLDRLSRSQDQLARVTRIEADINALLLSGYAPSTMADQARALREIEDQLAGYSATIADELAAYEDSPAMRDRQAEEAARAVELGVLVADLRESLQGFAQSVAAGPAAAEAQRRSLDRLAARIEQGEEEEAREAIAAMRSLKARTLRASLIVFAFFAALAGLGAWAMGRSMGRPLRRLEAAAERVGAARPDTPAEPLRPQGFAEIQNVARAFNRLEEEVTAQREALARHAQTLEAEVAERTAEIEAGRERLAEIDGTRRKFFSKVSHELRTPATVIRGEAEVALRNAEATVDYLKEALEHIAANSAFLQRRLDDLLALARAEDGRIVLRREPIQLNRLLSGVVALAEPYTRSSGLVLTGDGLDGEELVVMGDESWLQQALLVLVDNAAKFAAGSPGVRLSLHADEGEAHIRVTDGGPGVDPDALPFLFDSYFQGPEGARAGGAGVGLSVTRWVVEQHGGQVSARNVTGQGLTIELSLPMTA